MARLARSSAGGGIDLRLAYESVLEDADAPRSWRALSPGSGIEYVKRLSARVEVSRYWAGSALGKALSALYFRIRVAVHPYLPRALSLRHLAPHGALALSRKTPAPARRTPQASAPAPEPSVRPVVASALIALVAFYLAGAVEADDGAAMRPAVPAEPVLAIMIKTPLIAFDHGASTGDHTVLRDLAAPLLGDADARARVAAAFAEVRRSGIDIASISGQQPQLTRPPVIDERGNLRLRGHFETEPQRLAFAMTYREVDSVWRLYGIGVEARARPVAEGIAADPLQLLASADAKSLSLRWEPSVFALGPWPYAGQAAGEGTVLR